MAHHFDRSRAGRHRLDPDLAGLHPVFAARVQLHRAGWTTRALALGAGRHVAVAVRDGRSIRCEAPDLASAWDQLLAAIATESAPVAR